MSESLQRGTLKKKQNWDEDYGIRTVGNQGRKGGRRREGRDGGKEGP